LKYIEWKLQNKQPLKSRDKRRAQADRFGRRSKQYIRWFLIDILSDRKYAF
jgi:hypothetical protein